MWGCTAHGMLVEVGGQLSRVSHSVFTLWFGDQTPQAFMTLALSLAPAVSFAVIVSFAFLIRKTEPKPILFVPTSTRLHTLGGHSEVCVRVCVYAHVCKCDTVYVSVFVCVNECSVRGREGEICCGSYKALISNPPCAPSPAGDYFFLQSLSLLSCGQWSPPPSSGHWALDLTPMTSDLEIPERNFLKYQRERQLFSCPGRTQELLQDTFLHFLTC